MLKSPQKQESCPLLNELDLQVKMLLEQFHANAAQHPVPSTPLSAEEKIVATRQMMASFAALAYPFESVSRTEDFDITGSGGEVPVRLYVPHTKEPNSSATPVFVYYHGGGFVTGDLESHDTLLRALANRAQCTVISVAYRLVPENPYPAANDDAWSALTWIADHASEISVDPQRIAVGGDSAGGLLAAWVAQKAAKMGPTLRLQVLLYPNLGATTSDYSRKELGTGAYFLSHSQMIEWYDAYLPQGINREDPKVSRSSQQTLPM
jgi:acetyl esterase